MHWEEEPAFPLPHIWDKDQEFNKWEATTGAPDIANKNAGHLFKFEFQINELFFGISKYILCNT